MTRYYSRGTPDWADTPEEAAAYHDAIDAADLECPTLTDEHDDPYDGPGRLSPIDPTFDPWATPVAPAPPKENP